MQDAIAGRARPKSRISSARLRVSVANAGRIWHVEGNPGFIPASSCLPDAKKHFRWHLGLRHRGGEWSFMAGSFYMPCTKSQQHRAKVAVTTIHLPTPPDKLPDRTWSVADNESPDSALSSQNLPWRPSSRSSACLITDTAKELHLVLGNGDVKYIRGLTGHSSVVAVGREASSWSTPRL